MSTLHLCIATGQNSANLLPLKQLQAQEVWILETPEMKASHSGSDLKTALAPYAAEVCRIDFDDSSPQTINACALRLADTELDGRDVVFHVTGGTKLMVLAIHAQLQNLKAGTGSLRVLYADTKHQILNWLDDAPRQEALQDVLSLQDLLVVRGYRTTNDTRHAKSQQLAATRAKITREMGENAARYGRFFSVLATVANQAVKSGNLHQAFDFPPGGHAATLLAMAASSGLIEWQEGDVRITFADTGAASYFAGDWPEEYVFLKLPGLFKVGQYAIGAKVLQARTKTENEIDAIVVHNNRALVVECKTSRQLKAQDAIYKLGQVLRQVGGLFARGLYVSAQNVGEADRRRAQEYGIDVMAGDELQGINKYLRDWKG